MFWILITGIFIPTVLVLLVLTRDRYSPWLRRYRFAICLFLGSAQLALGVLYLVRGVPRWEGWVRVISSMFMAGFLFWMAFQARREAALSTP